MLIKLVIFLNKNAFSFLVEKSYLRVLAVAGAVAEAKSFGSTTLFKRCERSRLIVAIRGEGKKIIFRGGGVRGGT